MSSIHTLTISFFLGISSGIPLLATGSTLQAWMKDEGLSLASIGLITLVGLPYNFKFLWSPLIDRFVPPFLGRRRGWILITQIATAGAIALLALASTPSLPLTIGAFALLVAFCSASHDIVLDAHRRDILSDRDLALGSSLFINGYRIGMLISGAGALALADHIPWRIVYLLIAGALLICTIATFFAPEPELEGKTPANLREAVINPLRNFFERRSAWLMLAFILLYKAGDSMASAMTTPFILDMGYTKTQLAAVVKTFGLVASIGGGLLGGILMLRLDMYRALLYFGLLQSVSIVVFSVITVFPGDLSVLAVVIALENMAFGMGTAAFAAWMSALSDRRFSATQYALFSSLAAVPRTILSSPTGYLAQYFGWLQFFVLCSAAAIPGLLVLAWLDRTRTRPPHS